MGGISGDFSSTMKWNKRTLGKGENMKAAVTERKWISKGTMLELRDLGITLESINSVDHECKKFRENKSHVTLYTAELLPCK